MSVYLSSQKVIKDWIDYNNHMNVSYLSSQKVIKDWIDYNDHMNVSYYLLMFDKYGADTLK